ncbi:MAG: ABC transporter ATP-binding protein [Elusimicrobia bacterium]|nr:ABC transporter ATP-binding protein [Elusimicrobiota bacterium]
MIKVENLKHSFGSFEAVRGISFEVSDGEILSLIGPNGAGKTTVLNVLSGILLPDSGAVEISGTNIFENPRKAKGITAYIPEQPYLWGKLTGMEFLNFTRRIYDSGISDEELEKLMSEFNIFDWRNRLIETYSHGIKQKFIFLTIPIINPKVILLDEPLVGLDPIAVNLVCRMLARFVKSGAAILMSTHVLSFAERIADRVSVIDKGKIVFEGWIKEILETRKSSLEEIFLKEIPR